VACQADSRKLRCRSGLLLTAADDP